MRTGFACRSTYGIGPVFERSLPRHIPSRGDIVWRVSGIRPFPVQGPVRPESRQIGRGPAIDGLFRQTVELEQHTLLLADRRLGRTSMAFAVLDRLRGAGGWALEVDLSSGPVTTAAVFAERLAEQARAAGVRVKRRGSGWRTRRAGH